jgi:hypothetical protein
MLQWGNPFLWGVLVPILILLLLASIPYIFPKPHESELGRWFPASGRVVQVTVAIIALLIILLTALGSFSVNA